MTCGIYGIRNKESGRTYVGQSVDIERRHGEHRADLRKQQHFNVYLQRAWDKYGEGNFDFVILEECTIPNLSSQEQHWIDMLPAYNLLLDVTTHAGSSNPFYGKTHTLEARQLMAAAKTQKYLGTGNPNYGKQHTAVSRIKMSEGRSGKLTAGMVLSIKMDLQEDILSQQQIAVKHQISRTTVTRIASGTRWANVTGGPVSRDHVGNKAGNKLSENHRNRIGKGRLGKKHTEEAKAKMRKGV